jgi:radical SAM protein with 4Fe4S-binding SPASM domain
MSQIFNPKNKILHNLDYVKQLISEGYSPPILVEVDPSNTCNHGCYFCISSYIHLPESKNLETFDRSIMPRSMLITLCDDLIKLGVKAINWTGGGEPTVNSAFKEAIRHIGNNSDIKMGIFTNGVLLDRWDLFETLVDYMTWVRFSVDAGTEDTYNTVRRVKKGQDWNKMLANLSKLIECNNSKGKKIDIGVGFVITPDTYHEIVDFAKVFADYDVDYCQFKPEIVNREREDGKQREQDFWYGEVEPRLQEAKEILGNKFEINGYKLSDLEKDPQLYGRNYKKCLGSQVQPCVGADGNVYVCTNHRGYKQYSYGSLYEKSFIDIWKDVKNRKAVMHLIEEEECFSNCTQLCKPHESNKIMWDIFKSHEKEEPNLWKSLDDQKEVTTHKEFI